jgi:hypothetical protein
LDIRVFDKDLSGRLQKKLTMMGWMAMRWDDVSVGLSAAADAICIRLFLLLMAAKFNSCSLMAIVGLEKLQSASGWWDGIQDCWNVLSWPPADAETKGKKGKDKSESWELICIIEAHRSEEPVET